MLFGKYVMRLLPPTFDRSRIAKFFPPDFVAYFRELYLSTHVAYTYRIVTHYLKDLENAFMIYLYDTKTVNAFIFHKDNVYSVKSFIRECVGRYWLAYLNSPKSDYCSLLIYMLYVAICDDYRVISPFIYSYHLVSGFFLTVEFYFVYFRAIVFTKFLAFFSWVVLTVVCILDVLVCVFRVDFLGRFLLVFYSFFSVLFFSFVNALAEINFVVFRIIRNIFLSLFYLCIECLMVLLNFALLFCGLLLYPLFFVINLIVFIFYLFFAFFYFIYLFIINFSDIVFFLFFFTLELFCILIKFVIFPFYLIYSVFKFLRSFLIKKI